MGRDPEVTSGLKKLYGDGANWPGPAKQQMQPFRISPEVWGFISRAIAARGRLGAGGRLTIGPLATRPTAGGQAKTDERSQILKSGWKFYLFTMIYGG